MTLNIGKLSAWCLQSPTELVMTLFIVPRNCIVGKKAFICTLKFRHERTWSCPTNTHERKSYLRIFLSTDNFESPGAADRKTISSERLVFNVLF